MRCTKSARSLRILIGEPTAPSNHPGILFEIEIPEAELCFLFLQADVRRSDFFSFSKAAWKNSAPISIAIANSSVAVLGIRNIRPEARVFCVESTGSRKDHGR